MGYSIVKNRDNESELARAARLADIRRQIEAGTYETPARLSAAADKLLKRLLPMERPTRLKLWPLRNSEPPQL